MEPYWNTHLSMGGRIEVYYALSGGVWALVPKVRKAEKELITRTCTLSEDLLAASLAGETCYDRTRIE